MVLSQTTVEALFLPFEVHFSIWSKVTGLFVTHHHDATLNLGVGTTLVSLHLITPHIM